MPTARHPKTALPAPAGRPTMLRLTTVATLLGALALSAAAQTAYAGTDPGVIPARRITGPATVTPASLPALARVAVPTDAGIYLVLLSRTPGQPWVVERTVVNLGQVATRDVDNFLVELDQRHLLYRRMLKEFVGRSTVAATDDQCAAWVSLSDGWHMDKVFVVEKLITFGGHEVAVQSEQATELRGIPDLVGLKRRVARFDQVSFFKVVAGVVVQGLYQVIFVR